MHYIRLFMSDGWSPGWRLYIVLWGCSAAPLAGGIECIKGMMQSDDQGVLEQSVLTSVRELGWGPRSFSRTQSAQREVQKKGRKGPSSNESWPRSLWKPLEIETGRARTRSAGIVTETTAGAKKPLDGYKKLFTSRRWSLLPKFLQMKGASNCLRVHSVLILSLFGLGRFSEMFWFTSFRNK